MTKPLNKTLAMLIAFLMCMSTLLPILTLSEAQAQEVTSFHKTQVNSEKSSFSESQSFKASSISPYSTSSDGLNYSILNETNKTCEITGYTGSAVALVIPSQINGYTVTSIGEYAFCDCTGLTNVTIPDSVTSIGNSAFYYCTGLTSVTIPYSVTSIGNLAFSNCTDLRAINVDADNSAYSSTDGILFNNSKTDLIQYPAGKSGSSYTIPNSVTSIGILAFSDCADLTSITIPGSVKSLGDGAFYYCTGLISVTIPDSVTSVGSSAFYYCTGLRSVTIPDSVTSIGEWAFYYCTGLTSVTIPDSVRSIGAWAFSSCAGLMSVTIPDSVTNIGREAFYACIGLTSVTIPDSVTSIGADTFLGCTGLTSVTFNGDPPETFEKNVFGNCADDFCIYYYSTYAYNWSPNGESTWHDYPVKALSAPVPDGLTYSILNETNKTCEITAYTGSATALVIPSQIDGYMVTSIGEYAFCDCAGLTSVTIPGSVESLGSWAFSDCAGLTSITIPARVKSLGDGAFYYCTGLRAINVDADNSAYSSTDGVLFNKSKTDLIQYPAGKSGSSYTIPDSVKNIGILAFSDCADLTSVTIPSSLKSLGDGAFRNCTSLMNVTIPDSVTSIGSYAFERCTSLTSVTIPDSIESIGDSAFSGCTGLTSVTFNGDPPSTFGTDVFFACANDFCIYYYSEYASNWSPHGETTWYGYPVKAINVVSPTPTPDGKVRLERTYVLNAANRLNTYFKNNVGNLPKYVTINETRIYMPEFLGMMAELIVDNSNNIICNVARNAAVTHDKAYEALTEGSITQAQYAALAESVTAYIEANVEAPGCMETALGTLSFQTMLKTFASICTTLRNTSSLPASAAVTAWGAALPTPTTVAPTPQVTPTPDGKVRLERTYVLNAANRLNTYFKNNVGNLPKYVTINETRIYMPEFLGMMAELIVDSNNNIIRDIARNATATYGKAYEALTEGSITQAQYAALAESVTAYIETNVEAPGCMVTALGTLSFQTMLKTFASICTTLRNTSSLPASAAVTAWGAALPTPIPQYT